jgi:myo-inositol-1(or 4)-monophosphatase
VTLSQQERKRYLDAAIDVARMAGARAEVWFNKRDKLVVEEKGAQDYVSQADKKTEELIVEELKQRFPDHAFYGEEGGKAQPLPGQPVWVIDPIDGTTNFLRGIPVFAQSLGLVVDGVPTVGVIHLPRTQETFAASLGDGATIDSLTEDAVRIQAASAKKLDHSLIAVGSSSRLRVRGVNEIRTKLSEQGVELRRLGSACVEICYVACGRLDGYLELHLNSWDVAAGLVILREAGARTNAFDTGPWLTDGNPFLCATPSLYDELALLTNIS